MSDRAYAKVQIQQKTVIRSSSKNSLLQRTCACGQHTIAGGECSACRNEQSTLHRSQRAFEPPSAPVAVQGTSPAQENGTSLHSAFDRATRFGQDFSQIPIHALQTSVPQTKLKVHQPGDVYEQDADQAAEQVMRMIDRGPSGSDGEDEAKTSVMRKQSSEPQADPGADISSVPPVVHTVLRSGGGQPLDTTTRAFMEPRFGHDFSHVRVHTDRKAAESAQAVNALAYAVGRDVVFGTAQYAPETNQGRHLLAHELTHVMQQNGCSTKSGLKLGTTGSAAEKEADQIAAKIARQRDGVEALGIQHASLSARVMRYETGEHAQFGETGDVLKTYIAGRAFTYRVKSGETLEKIAAKFGVAVKDLKEANSTSLKKWRTTRGSGKKDSGGNIVEGFNAGEEITIPPIVNEFTQEALKSKELIFTINGVKLEYGVGISMGDFYENAAQMVNAPATELEALAALIRKEKSGMPVSTKEWDDATNGRYHLLAEKNESHFAPSNPKLVDVSSAPHGSDHKTEWQKYHKTALDKSQAGSKNEALQVNSFGDHFLTDAFAAGHLINKRDVMEKFKGSLIKNASGDFVGDAKTFFDSVAKTAFVGSVKTEFSKYETVDSYNRHGQKDPSGWFHPSIDEESRFSSLLQGIQDKEPDVLANAVAKAVHDNLNTQPKGVSVENAKGEKWGLSGDGTLNAKSKEIGRKAVAQSQLNIFDVFKTTGTLDYPSKYKKVWDYVPFPTASGETDIKAKVTSGTSPKDAGLISAVVTLINTNYLLILKELVARKILKKS